MDKSKNNVPAFNKRHNPNLSKALYNNPDNKSRQKGYWMFEKDVTLKAKQERGNRQLGGAYGI